MAGSGSPDHWGHCELKTAWENVTVTVKDRQSGQRKDILPGVHGIVRARELLAIMDHRACRLW